MAASSDLAAFFTLMTNLGGVIVKEQPKLDLDLYISNYTGRTRFDRLLLIGRSCIPLSVDALKAAVVEAKQGSDVERYRRAWDCIRVAAPGEPEAVRDDQWMEATDRRNNIETDRLDVELKGYRNNLIKESIRMGNEDIGRHLEKIGRLSDAADAYSRMRHDVSTTKHIIDCAMHIIDVSLQRHDWPLLLSNVGKMNGVQIGEDNKGLQSYIKIVAGIGALGLEHFYDAAKSFLQADFNIPASEYSHIASPNDVAVYGGLLALATMDRKELQIRVLDNQSFRTFLECEPHIRKAISLFVNSRYSACLSILESARNDYLLDIYLQPHVSAIYSQIRSKCIVQYFVPFSCVTLASLDESFSKPGESVEEELVEMIREGSLKARIDSKEKLLVAIRPDPRLEMQKSALEVARKYEQEAAERLRRMSIISASLEVANNTKKSGAGPSGMEELWYDDGRSAPVAGGVES